MQRDKTVAVVGTGLIGRAWAAIFARAGWNVRLTDPHGPTLEAAPGLIRDELRALARRGLADDPDGATARLTIAASLQVAVLRAGEWTRADRRKARDICRAGSVRAQGRAAGVFHFGHHRVAIH
jgi:3-hydroxyacyl-CoA dehydrogenase